MIKVEFWLAKKSLVHSAPIFCRMLEIRRVMLQYNDWNLHFRMIVYEKIFNHNLAAGRVGKNFDWSLRREMRATIELRPLLELVMIYLPGHADC